MRSASPTLVKVLVASLALLFLQPIGAGAGDITFHDLAETGVFVTFSPGLVERGSFVNCPTLEMCIVTLTAPPGTVLNSHSGTDANISEQDSPNVLSDTILISGNAGDSFATITFTSETEGVPLVPLPGAQSITENGQVQLCCGVNWGTTTLIFFSDAILFESDIVEAVPEPSTIFLALTFGLLSLAVYRRQGASRGVDELAVLPHR
jgi:hypothetical protein